MEVPLITFNDDNRLNTEEYKKFSQLFEQMSILSPYKIGTGKLLFDALYKVKPRLADSIRTTSADPCHHTDRVDDFFKKICDEESYLLVEQKFK